MFRIKKETRNTILWIAIPLIASLVIFQSGLFLIHAVVPSASMQPTMKVGSHFVGNHMAFWFRKPKVDEIIFFKKDLFQNGRKSLYVKRVVATEGNVVVISGGTELDPHVKVYEDKAAYEKAPHNKDERVLTVPKGSYFVEGDNRSNSYDSRFWKDPFVRADEVEGNVLFQF